LCFKQDFRIFSTFGERGAKLGEKGEEKEKKDVATFFFCLSTFLSLP